MRVTVYDKNPGPGVQQWFLKLSWLLGCFFQKLFGKVDDYKGVSSLDDLLDWLCYRDERLVSVQFWGHGSPGTIWIGGKPYKAKDFLSLKPRVQADSVVWFRACSVFQGALGHAFSGTLADGLGCTVAGHTRIIGLFQGGLHTRKPSTYPSWPASEAELTGVLAKSGLAWWGGNTVFCLSTKIPSGW
jgi:hypothetical protein